MKERVSIFAFLEGGKKAVIETCAVLGNVWLELQKLFQDSLKKVGSL